MAVSTTSLKLPAAKRYRGLLDDARRANVAMLKSGQGYDAGDVHDYILARARGEKVQRPKSVKWRK